MPGGQDNRNPYDVHFYFDEHDPKSIQSARDIKQKFEDTFDWAITFPLVARPVGPHPTGMWEGHFTKAKNPEEERKKVIEFFEKNRGNHQVLIHPNTNQVIKDHTTSAYWVSGDEKVLNIEILTKFVNGQL